MLWIFQWFSAKNIDGFFWKYFRISNLLNLRQKYIKNTFFTSCPAGIYLLKVSNRNTRTRCEICSKLTIKAPERRLGFLRSCFAGLMAAIFYFIFVLNLKEVWKSQVRKSNYNIELRKITSHVELLNRKMKNKILKVLVTRDFSTGMEYTI